MDILIYGWIYLDEWINGWIDGSIDVWIHVRQYVLAWHSTRSYRQPKSIILIYLSPDCGLPPNISNGEYDLLDQTTTFRSDVNYTCDSGYHINETSSVIQCQANKLWEDPPTCTLNGKSLCMMRSQHVILNVYFILFIPILAYICILSLHTSCNLSTTKYTDMFSSLIIGLAFKFTDILKRLCLKFKRINQSSRFNCSMSIDCDSDGSMIICEIQKNSVCIYEGMDILMYGWIHKWMNKWWIDGSIYGWIHVRRYVLAWHSTLWYRHPKFIILISLSPECSLPPNISNGNYELLNQTTTFRSEVNYNCDSGYHINETSSVIQCQANKLWEDAPICTINGKSSCMMRSQLVILNVYSIAK